MYRWIFGNDPEPGDLQKLQSQLEHWDAPAILVKWEKKKELIKKGNNGTKKKNGAKQVNWDKKERMKVGLYNLLETCSDAAHIVYRRHFPLDPWSSFLLVIMFSPGNKGAPTGAENMFAKGSLGSGGHFCSLGLVDAYHICNIADLFVLLLHLFVCCFVFFVLLLHLFVCLKPWVRHSRKKAGSRDPGSRTFFGPN